MAAPRSNWERNYVQSLFRDRSPGQNLTRQSCGRDLHPVKVESEFEPTVLNGATQPSSVTGEPNPNTMRDPLDEQAPLRPVSKQPTPPPDDLPSGTTLSRSASSSIRSLSIALQEDYRKACMGRLIQEFGAVKPPITVDEYIHTHRFDAGRFAALPFAQRVGGDYPHSVRIKGRTISTRWGAWTNRWRNWSKIPAALKAPQDCDMAWFRHPSEVDYFARVKADIKRVINGDLIFEHVSDLTCHLPRPLTSCYFYAETAIWARDMSTEFRLRRHHINFSGIQRMRPCQPLFVGWHNTEVFHMSLSRRPSWYVPVWEEFYRHWEASPVIVSPSPWTPMLFGHLIMKGDSRVRSYLRANAFLEFVYICFARFLHTAQYGVGYNQLGDPGLKHARLGVLAPVPCFHQIVVDNQGVLNILKGSDIDQARALLAWERSREIDWSVFPRVIGKTGPYLYYDWDTGQVLPVPERITKIIPLKPEDESEAGQPRQVTLPEMKVAWHRAPCTLNSCQTIVEQYWRASDEPALSRSGAVTNDGVTTTDAANCCNRNSDGFETRALTVANEALKTHGVASVRDAEHFIAQVPIWIKAYYSQDTETQHDNGCSLLHEYRGRRGLGTKRSRISSLYLNDGKGRKGYGTESDGNSSEERDEPRRRRHRPRVAVHYGYNSQRDAVCHDTDYDKRPLQRRRVGCSRT